MREVEDSPNRCPRCQRVQLSAEICQECRDGDGSLVLVLSNMDVQRLLERGLLHRLDDGWYIGNWPDVIAVEQEE